MRGLLGQCQPKSHREFVTVLGANQYVFQAMVQPFQGKRLGYNCGSPDADIAEIPSSLRAS